MFKKIFLLNSILSVALFACDANCVTCHPSLVKNGKMDVNHKILNNCVRCHTPNEEQKSHDTCGADCWSCHDIKKVSKINIPEHKVLSKCIKCHVALDKQFFYLKKDNDNFVNKYLKNNI